jgi:hypothetical protein
MTNLFKDRSANPSYREKVIDPFEVWKMEVSSHEQIEYLVEAWTMKTSHH